jgi:hypothetical protein
MIITNRPGVIGVVLAVALGFALDAVLRAGPPGFSDLSIHLGGMFLGLYALSVDRCEVPGLLASYRANMQNFVATASASGLGRYDKPIVPGRRLSWFILPVVITPLITFPIGLVDAWLLFSRNGRLLPSELDGHVTIPFLGVVVWAAYAVATEKTGLRRRLGDRHDPVGWH